MEKPDPRILVLELLELIRDTLQAAESRRAVRLIGGLADHWQERHNKLAQRIQMFDQLDKADDAAAFEERLGEHMPEAATSAIWSKRDGWRVVREFLETSADPDDDLRPSAIDDLAAFVGLLGSWGIDTGALIGRLRDLRERGLD